MDNTVAYRAAAATDAVPRRQLSVAAVACAALLATSGLAQAAPARTTADLSLRAGPSTSYQRLTVMPQGARVDVERCTPGYGWCELSYNGYDGWASANYLNIARQDADAPIAQVNIDLPIPIFDFFSEIGGGAPDGGDDEDDEQPDVGRGEVCFYADFDYQGESFCASQGEANNQLSQNWNDRISSIRTGPGTAVLVCEHYDFAGNCRRISGNVESFSGNWNDVISSYEVGGRVPDRGDGDNGGEDGNGDDGRAAGPGPGEFCFYEDFGYGGRSFCASVGQQEAQLRSSRNDAISSIRVGQGATVQVCEDYDFDGNCRRISSDIESLGDGWNDVISSYRSRSGMPGNGGGNGGGDDGRRPGPNEVCFYQDFGYGGGSTCAAAGQSEPQLSGDWNDAISSIRLGDDAELQVCEDYDFGGNCRRINSNAESLGDGWNDTISSYRVR